MNFQQRHEAQMKQQESTDKGHFEIPKSDPGPR